jgi:TolA-binding protein
MESLIDALPSVIVSSLVAVIGAGITLFVANRAGVGDISQAVDRENDRLVAKQAQRIELLEKEVEELKASNRTKDIMITQLTERIDELERLVSDQQIEINKAKIEDLQRR